MGRATSSKSGKSVPSAQPIAGSPVVCTEGPPSLHQQRAHERNGRRFKGAIAAKEALDDRLAGQGFRPYASEGAGVAQGLARVGALVRVRKGAPQTGQVTRQAFRQCFGTTPEAPSRAC